MDLGKIVEATPDTLSPTVDNIVNGRSKTPPPRGRPTKSGRTEAQKRAQSKYQERKRRDAMEKTGQTQAKPEPEPEPERSGPKLSSNKTQSQSGTKPNDRIELEFDVDGLAKQIYAMHLMLSVVMKSQAFVISSEESEKLAIAVIAVSKQYPITINPKYIALGNLTLVCASIYIPRLMIYSQEVKAHKHTASDTVIDHD